MSAPGWEGAPIELEVPAHRDLVAVVRAVARSSAALANLGVEDVEDVQLAVDEAATLLLPLVDHAVPTAVLQARFEVDAGALCIELSAWCREGVDVDRSGLPWIMLTGLDPDVEVTREGPVLAIAVRRSRAESDA